MDPLLALSTRLSDDPLGLFLAVSASGFTAWILLYNAWQVIRGLSRPSD